MSDFIPTVLALETIYLREYILPLTARDSLSACYAQDERQSSLCTAYLFICQQLHRDIDYEKSLERPEKISARDVQIINSNYTNEQISL